MKLHILSDLHIEFADFEPPDTDDFAHIRQGAHRFRPEDSVELHEASRAWLAGQLEQAFDGPTVVITHHLPALKSVAPRYANDPLEPGICEPAGGRHRKTSADALDSRSHTRSV